MRKLIGTPSDSDKALFADYEKWLDVNSVMTDACDLYALADSCALQPYVYKGKPRLRAIPNDRFFVVSVNGIDPMSEDIFVTFEKGDNGEMVFYCYSDTEFLIVDSNEMIRSDLMAKYDASGINPFGTIPFIYANASRFRLMPSGDKTKLCMSILIPVLLTDLNFAVKFQAFSILYSIDLDEQEVKLSPNALFRLKSDRTNPNSKPEIGSIKPEIDITEVLGLIQAEISLWLNSMGIRPGAVGQLTEDSFASGVAKIIDESDTYDVRLELSDYFGCIEEITWQKIMYNMHPVWVKQMAIENVTQLFTPQLEVQTIFALTAPTKDRAKLVKEVKDELEAGFITRMMAMKKLHPDLSDKEIEDLIIEIDSEKAALEPPPEEMVPGAKPNPNGAFN